MDVSEVYGTWWVRVCMWEHFSGLKPLYLQHYSYFRSTEFASSKINRESLLLKN